MYTTYEMGSQAKRLEIADLRYVNLSEMNIIYCILHQNPVSAKHMDVLPLNTVSEQRVPDSLTIQVCVTTSQQDSGKAFLQLVTSAMQI